MPFYFQMDGIQGDATQESHVKWMDIQTMHWNVSRNVNTLAGAAANREASEPAVSEVTLTKISDSSTTKLFQAACTGTSIWSAPEIPATPTSSISCTTRSSPHTP